jgi:hypothetical protein
MRSRVAAMALVLALALVTGLVTGGRAARADDGRVDLLLVLAADVSRSVNERKFKLQREGYAAALVDPRVLRAIADGPLGRIAIVFVEWGSEFEQFVSVDWMVITGETEARKMSSLILGAPRPFWGRTSISSAIDYSMSLLARTPLKADRQVIDVSGDGTNNSGRDVTVARDTAVEQGVTINGLVILSETPLITNPAHTHPPGGLTAYYENNVIGGPGAFVVEANGFEQFGESLAKKLVREIAEISRMVPTRVASTDIVGD